MLDSTTRGTTSPRTALLGVGVVLIATVIAGCSSSNTTTNQTTAPAVATTSAPAHATGSAAPASGAPEADAATTAAVTDAFVKFFDSTTPPDQKIALVENGQAFAPTINAQAGSPMAQGTTATVSHVALTAPDRAAVTYTILLNGSPALQDQAGWAVKADETWKVSQETFCALLTLQGNPPPVCGAPTTTAATPS